ncbi:MAG: hypothetical protein WBE18_02290 [Gammaproteobacteria bacterium]
MDKLAEAASFIYVSHSNPETIKNWLLDECPKPKSQEYWTALGEFSKGFAPFFQEKDGANYLEFISLIKDLQNHASLNAFFDKYPQIENYLKANIEKLTPITEAWNKTQAESEKLLDEDKAAYQKVLADKQTQLIEKLAIIHEYLKTSNNNQLFDNALLDKNNKRYLGNEKLSELSPHPYVKFVKDLKDFYAQQTGVNNDAFKKAAKRFLEQEGGQVNRGEARISDVDKRTTRAILAEENVDHLLKYINNLKQATPAAPRDSLQAERGQAKKATLATAASITPTITPPLEESKEAKKPASIPKTAPSITTPQEKTREEKPASTFIPVQPTAPLKAPLKKQVAAFEETLASAKQKQTLPAKTCDAMRDENNNLFDAFANFRSLSEVILSIKNYINKMSQPHPYPIPPAVKKGAEKTAETAIFSVGFMITAEVYSYGHRCTTLATIMMVGLAVSVNHDYSVTVAIMTGYATKPPTFFSKCNAAAAPKPTEVGSDMGEALRDLPTPSK